MSYAPYPPISQEELDAVSTSLELTQTEKTVAAVNKLRAIQMHKERTKRPLHECKLLVENYIKSGDKIKVFLGSDELNIETLDDLADYLRVNKQFVARHIITYKAGDIVITEEPLPVKSFKK